MHDIDSIRLEATQDQHEYQEFQESEADQGEQGVNMLMSEAEEEALAAELLGVGNVEEMDQFLGKLFRRIGRGVRGAAKFLARNAGPLSGVLKGIARKALPFLGGALGSAIPIPGVGTALGSALGQAAGNLLESETEHLEVDEREFEVARRYVRLASHAVWRGARVPRRYRPSAASRIALRNAVLGLRRAGGFRQRPAYGVCAPCAPCAPCPACSQTAPTADTGVAGEPVSGGATNGGTPGADAGGGDSNGESEFEIEPESESVGGDYETDQETTPGSGHSGRWVRRGSKIVLYGI
ncbi:MAG: hypothetical protein AB7O66_23695 [Limisphaerales bacterium]